MRPSCAVGAATLGSRIGDKGRGRNRIVDIAHIQAAAFGVRPVIAEAAAVYIESGAAHCSSGGSGPVIGKCATLHAAGSGCRVSGDGPAAGSSIPGKGCIDNSGLGVDWVVEV